MNRVISFVLVFISSIIIFFIIGFIAFNTARQQNNFSLVITELIFLLGVFYIPFATKDKEEKYALKITHIVAAVYFFYGIIGIASWGFLSTREGELTSIIYMLMVLQSFILFAISYTIYMNRKSFLVSFYTSFIICIVIFLITFTRPTQVAIRREFNNIIPKMNNLQTMIETYKVDHGVFPEDYKQLEKDAIKQNYYKIIENVYDNSDTEPVITLSKVEDTKYYGSAGKLIYNPVTINDKIHAYYIYSVNNNQRLLKHYKKIYVLSNE